MEEHNIPTLWQLFVLVHKIWLHYHCLKSNVMLAVFIDFFECNNGISFGTTSVFNVNCLLPITTGMSCCRYSFAVSKFVAISAVTEYYFCLVLRVQCMYSSMIFQLPCLMLHYQVLLNFLVLQPNCLTLLDDHSLLRIRQPLVRRKYLDFLLLGNFEQNDIQFHKLNI